MTGLAAEEEVEKARKLGVRDCVQKPLSPEALTKLLSSIPECIPHLQVGQRH
jgi:CheY-like chemotaxis protein